MLISLVKKDFIMAKKELLIIFAFTVGVPIFITMQLGPDIGKTFGFFITALFMLYILFNSVSMTEFKYKGSSLLCATPYTRSTMVRAKYMFMLINFLFVYIIYLITASVSNIGLTALNIYDFGMSFLIITIFFGIVIPFQYKFGFQKTKYISYFIVFMTPFIGPLIVKWLETNNINLNISLPVPPVISGLIPCVLAIMIGYISMAISIHIYSGKNL